MYVIVACISQTANILEISTMSLLINMTQTKLFIKSTTSAALNVLTAVTRHHWAFDVHGLFDVGFSHRLFPQSVPC